MNQMGFLPPVASIAQIDIDLANASLVAWAHKMGPLRRPMGVLAVHGLFHHSEIDGIAASCTTIREHAAGVPREDAVELARLCCVRPGLCRVLLRLWREFVFPCFGVPWAVSYQDAALHTGNLYRFDGWVRLGTSRSGTDTRSGRKGRSKVIWGWSGAPELMAAQRSAHDR